MWKHYQPTRICFGEGEVHRIETYLQEANMRRALLIADPVNVRLGIADQLIKESGGRISGIISDVEPNPTTGNIDSCVAKAKEIGAQCVVALGGGSVIDCAKATAAALFESCSGKELLDGHKISGALPIAAIPTTSGTGSEVTAGAVISDKEQQIKGAIFNSHLFARIAIIDPELTYTCPKSVTASSGIDVIAHALDALTSVKANPITDIFAVKAASIAFSYLERAVDDGLDKTARKQMSLASILAGKAFSQTGTTASHACSYILTARYNLPHGEACAYTLDYWFKHSARYRKELDYLVRDIGYRDVEAVCNKISYLKKKFHFRSNWEAVGIKEVDVGDIVINCYASSNMRNNVGTITEEEIRSLFMDRRE